MTYSINNTAFATAAEAAREAVSCCRDYGDVEVRFGDTDRLYIRAGLDANWVASNEEGAVVQVECGETVNQVFTLPMIVTEAIERLIHAVGSMAAGVRAYERERRTS